MVEKKIKYLREEIKRLKTKIKNTENSVTGAITVDQQLYLNRLRSELKHLNEELSMWEHRAKKISKGV